MPEGCYICQPENPNAPEDGCAACQADWEAYYYAVEVPGFAFIDNTVIADDGTTHRWCEEHRTYHPDGFECVAYHRRTEERGD